MSLRIGEEFAIRAGDQEWWRKQGYLAATDNGSVLTPGTGANGATSGERRVASAGGMADMIQMLDQQRQEQIRQISDELDRLDEASVAALQEIEEELLAIRLARGRMLEQAYRDEQGRAIFMTEDESAAFYEDGTQLADDEFAAIRDQLAGKPTMESWQESFLREEELTAEAAAIHALQDDRDQLRQDVADGQVSPDDAAAQTVQLQSALPERVRRNYRPPAGEATASPPAPANAEPVAGTAAEPSPAEDKDTAPPPSAAKPGW